MTTPDDNDQIRHAVLLAVRYLAEYRLSTPDNPTTDVLAEVEANDRWAEAVVGMGLVARGLLAVAASATNTTEADTLRHVSTAIMDPAAETAVPDSETGAQSHPRPGAEHPSFEDLVDLARVLYPSDVDADEDAAQRHALLLLTAMLTGPQNGPDASNGDLLAGLMREHRDEHGDMDLLVQPLVMLNMLTLHALLMHGGPTPLDTLAAYRQGHAQTAGELGPVDT